MGMTLMPSPGGSESYVSLNLFLIDKVATRDLMAVKMYTFRNESDLFQLVSVKILPH